MIFAEIIYFPWPGRRRNGGPGCVWPCGFMAASALHKCSSRQGSSLRAGHRGAAPRPGRHREQDSWEELPPRLTGKLGPSLSFWRCGREGTPLLPCPAPAQPVGPRSRLDPPGGDSWPDLTWGETSARERGETRIFNCPGLDRNTGLGF